QIGRFQRYYAMLDLDAWMLFGKEISDLFHLERTFESNGKIELPPEEQDAASIDIFFSNRFELVAQVESFFDLRRQCLKRSDYPASFRSGTIAHPSLKQPNQRVDGK